MKRIERNPESLNYTFDFHHPPVLKVGLGEPFMRLEKDGSIIALASARPLEEAVWRASIQLMDWLVDEYKCSQRKAYLLLGINPDFRVNVYQMALVGKLQYTVGAEISKRCLANVS